MLTEKMYERIMDNLCPICGNEVSGDSSHLLNVDGLNFEICGQHPIPEDLKSSTKNKVKGGLGSRIPYKNQKIRSVNDSNI